MELDTPFESRLQRFCFVVNTTCTLPRNKKISDMLQDLKIVLTSRLMLYDIRNQQLTNNDLKLSLREGLRIKTQLFFIGRVFALAEAFERGCGNASICSSDDRPMIRYPVLEGISLRTVGPHCLHFWLIYTYVVAVVN